MEWLREGCNFFILYRNEGVKIMGKIIYKYTEDFNGRAKRSYMRMLVGWPILEICQL